MTVTSTNQKVSFSGNGSTTVFAYNFKIFAQTDLLVILRSATGTETTQQLTSKYTVSGVGATSGGNVTMGTAPPSGTTLVIQRVQPQLQGLDLVPNDPFPAQSMEDALDKLVFNVQSLNEEVGRAIKASTTNTIGDTEFTISATDRANKLFSFDSSGNLSIAQELGTYRGNWAASTAYAVRDLVKDTSTGNIFIVITAHTSSGSQPITTNTDAAKWALIVDAASATTSKNAAAASATASANSATASSNSAATSSTKADESAASAATSSTKAGEASASATASANSATASANSATAAAASAADVAKVEGITNGTVSANKAMVVDSAKDITGGRNLTISGELDAGSLDISGDIDVDGTTNLDIVDIDGAVNMATTALVTGVLTTTAATVFNGGFASNAASSIGGTTPTLTIGDAGAEDAKIVFDGNAADYHVGLDDSEDALQIGLGAALGTTPRITIRAAEVVVNDLGIDLDFRVEGDADTHALFVEGETDRVSIGSNDPPMKLTVRNGTVNSDIAKFTGDGTGGGLTISTASTTRNDDTVVLKASDAFGEFSFVSDSTEVLRLNKDNQATLANGLTLTDGNLVVANGHGIDFSAQTQSGSTTTAELLDHYEEGTWTPVFQGSSGSGTYSFTSVTARYTRVGNLVTVSATLLNITEGTAMGGYVQIAGLPFTKPANTYGNGAVGLSQWNVGFEVLAPIIEPVTYANATTIVYIHLHRNNAGSSNLLISMLTDESSDIVFTFTYQV